jgi:hypothetical protein
MTLAGLALEAVRLIAELLIDIVATFEPLGRSKLLLVPELSLAMPFRPFFF